LQNKAEDKTSQKREILQLHRLERMADVVYAIIIWRCFMLLPRPTAEQWNWEFISTFLRDNVGAFISVLIGIVFTIIYWIQSNILFGKAPIQRFRYSRALPSGWD